MGVVCHSVWIDPVNYNVLISRRTTYLAGVGNLLHWSTTTQIHNYTAGNPLSMVWAISVFVWRNKSHQYISSDIKWEQSKANIWRLIANIWCMGYSCQTGSLEENNTSDSFIMLKYEPDCPHCSISCPKTE